MELNTVRQKLKGVLEATGLNQIEFATRHGLSYSWINKFLNEKANNPRFHQLQDLERAITKEERRVA